MRFPASKRKPLSSRSRKMASSRLRILPPSRNACRTAQIGCEPYRWWRSDPCAFPHQSENLCHRDRGRWLLPACGYCRRAETRAGQRRSDASRIAGGDLTHALSRIKAKTFVIAIEEDGFFPLADIAAEQKRVPDSADRMRAVSLVAI